MKNNPVNNQQKSCDVNDLVNTYGQDYVAKEYAEQIEANPDILQVNTTSNEELISRILNILNSANITYTRDDNNILYFRQKELDGYIYNFNSMKLEYQDKEKDWFSPVSGIIIYNSITISNDGFHNHRLSIVLDDDELMEVIVPIDTEPQNLLKKLHAQGLNAHYDSTRRKLCREFILRCNNVVKLKQYLKSEINNGFLDKTTYLFANTTLPVFIGSNSNKYNFDGYSTCKRQINGNIQDWKTNIADYCVGNPLFEFGLMLGFNGMLLRDLGIKLSTGFHIYSSKAGTGKTTLAKVAATIMGNTDYILHQWNQTANNLDLILAKSNDGFLVLDEMKQLKQNVLLSDIIMKIGNGSGAGRMAQDAKSSREQFKWLTCFLSTGNYPTEYFIAKQEREYMIAAEETRLYNIPMIEVKNLHSKESVQSFLTCLLHNTDRYYGIAGYEFMTKYLENHNESSMNAIRYKNKFHATLIDKYKGKDISERLLISLAAIYAAGKMAQAFDILPKSFEPEKTIYTILEHYLETRGGNRDSILYLTKLYDVVCTKKKQYFTFTAENGYQNQPIDDYGFIEGAFAHIVTTNFAKIYGESNYKCCAEIRKYLRQQDVLIPDNKDDDSKQHSDGKRYVKIDIKRLSALVA